VGKKRIVTPQSNAGREVADVTGLSLSWAIWARCLDRGR